MNTDRFSAQGELSAMIADIQAAETTEDLRARFNDNALPVPADNVPRETMRDMLMAHTWDFARQTGVEHPHAARRVMALAVMFSVFVRRELTGQQLRDAIADNHRRNDGSRTDAIHDYFDANMAMIYAQAAVGMVHDSASDECMDIVNGAWTCAKNCDYDPLRIVGDFDADE